jgi:hypothetical protein
MFKEQKGFFPFICKIFGLILFVYPPFVALIEYIPKLYSSFTLENVSISILASATFLLFPIWISLFLLKMFPKIQITEQGIKYLSFPIQTKLIKWDEMEGLVRFRNGFAALIFDKKGLILLNGLYYYKLYGMIVKAYKPVIILSPNILTQTQLLDVLKANNISGSGNRVFE